MGTENIQKVKRKVMVDDMKYDGRSRASLEVCTVIVPERLGCTCVVGGGISGVMRLEKLPKKGV